MYEGVSPIERGRLESRGKFPFGVRGMSLASTVRDLSVTHSGPYTKAKGRKYLVKRRRGGKFSMTGRRNEVRGLTRLCEREAQRMKE